MSTVCAPVTPDFVVAGNLLVDDLVFADGRTRMGQPGGAVLYATLGALLWGARVGCLSVLGDDYPGDALFELERRGADLSGLRTSGRPSLRTWLLYEGRVRHVVHRLNAPAHAEVSPTWSDVPASWRAARLFHLAPVPVVMQRAFADDAAAAGATVSVDPHHLLDSEGLPDGRALAAAAHFFWPSEDELLVPEAQIDPPAFLRALASGRSHGIAFKRGLKGGLYFDARSGITHAWTSRATQVVDPTGAGDAFAAGFLTAWLEGRPVEAALARAVVTASFAIEAWGHEGLLAATRAEADARLDAWFPAATTA